MKFEFYGTKPEAYSELSRTSKMKLFAKILVKNIDRPLKTVVKVNPKINSSLNFYENIKQIKIKQGKGQA